MSGLSTQDVYVDGKLVIAKFFHKSRHTQKGLVWEGSWEQACTKLHQQSYENRENVKQRKAARRNTAEYKEMASNYNKIYKVANSNRIRAENKLRYERNKELVREKQKAYWHKHREKRLITRRDTYNMNKKAILTAGKIWRANNTWYKILRNERDKARRNGNSTVRLVLKIRNLVRISFSRSITWYSKKPAKTHEILGCTLPELLIHITKQFDDGMTLENRGYGPGKWVIDHIIPIKAASDMATSDEEFQRMVVILNHHTNLRPMWWNENESKKDSYDIITASKLFKSESQCPSE